MNNISKEEHSQEELDEYSSISWQVGIYVLLGTLVAVAFDRIGLFGFLPEGIVRAIAGTADTLGLAFAAIFVLSTKFLRNRIPSLKKYLKDFGEPKAVTWIVGGLIGLALGFLVQAGVFIFSNDPHGPVGVIYAFGYSNLDNLMAGITVFLAAIINHGWNDGFRRYWKHPYFFGNAIMMIVIPLSALAVRLFMGFRPELNLSAGIEAGIMDVDSIGAAIIFMFSTRILHMKVPYVNESLSEALPKLKLLGNSNELTKDISQE